MKNTSTESLKYTRNVASSPAIMKFALAVAVAVAWLTPRCAGSPGNDLQEYDDCRYQCEQITCYRNPYHLVQQEIWHELNEQNRLHEYHWRNYNPDWTFDLMPLPSLLKLFYWTCESNCDYQCQILVTKDRVRNHQEIYQFHGKWPFTRVLGMQEIASVVFSLGNLLGNLYGFLKVVAAINQNKSTDRSVSNGQLTVIAFISLIAVFTWLFSAIFHVRDFEITEKLDYYFAGLTVLSGFYGIFSRVFKLYLPRKWLSKAVFTLVCLAAYSAHIYRLETDWLYTYNMQVNISVGVLQYILWGIGCFRLFTDYYNMEQEDTKSENISHLQYIQRGRMLFCDFYSKSPKLYSLYPLNLCFIVILGMSLEIFDFPPIFGLFDAHSLWHLVTIIPIYYGWYDWMLWDANENIWAELHAIKQKKEQ